LNLILPVAALTDEALGPTMPEMRHAAFTLVELLVVIAVTALLTGILLPVICRSRQQAKAVLCAANIKQIVLGMSMYEADNGTFPYGLDSVTAKPPAGGYSGNHAYDRPGWWWLDHISSYVRSDKGKGDVFWCPSHPAGTRTLQPNILWRNYGVNLSVCRCSSGPRSRGRFVGRPVSGACVRRPADTVILFDSGYTVISWWHATADPPAKLAQTREDTAYVPGLSINLHRLLWPGDEPDALGGRHPNLTINAAFVDGHTARLPAERLLVEKIEDGYRNMDFRWQP